MGRLIKNKKDNVLYGKFPKYHHMKNAPTGDFSDDHMASVVQLSKEPVPKEDLNYSSPARSWIHYGAVASVLLIMGGTTIFNLKNFMNEDQGRGLASIKSSSNMDNRILGDLKHGRLELTKANQPFSEQELLEERENFKYNVLNNSYRISFDHNGFVQEVQLKPNKDAIKLNNVKDFIHMHHAVFPPYGSLSLHKGRHFNESIELNVESFHLENSDKYLVAYTDKENTLVTLIIEESGSAVVK